MIDENFKLGQEKIIEKWIEIEFNKNSEKWLIYLIINLIKCFVYYIFEILKRYVKYRFLFMVKGRYKILYEINY